ncbi:iron chelate uptake ABC transporter family permease subunit [Paroceanicella profunda]|nr:iron chelate uptake ABC transporter family permease subunit [Paroceanicella profunda]
MPEERPAQSLPVQSLPGPVSAPASVPASGTLPAAGPGTAIAPAATSGTASAPVSPPAPRATPRRVLALLGLAALACAAAFMLWDAKGPWSFLLPFRGTKLAALLLVGYAVAVSTVVFQSVTGNRILTPAIMGFDALFILIQSVLAFGLGGLAVSGLDPRVMFLAQVAVMTGFALALYAWLFLKGGRSLHLVLLVGIVLGILFRSVAGLLQRLMDPGAFLTLQDRLFASFNTVNPTLLGLSALIVAGVSLAGLGRLHRLDVLHLGREGAINLGLDHRRTVLGCLAVVSVLVSVSTALVGPVTFLGLLVANLAWMLVRSHRHALVIPAAVLIAAICLVGGQAVLEHGFGMATALGILMEFFGGLFFLFLLLRGALR